MFLYFIALNVFGSFEIIFKTSSVLVVKFKIYFSVNFSSKNLIFSSKSIRVSIDQCILFII